VTAVVSDSVKIVASNGVNVTEMGVVNAGVVIETTADAGTFISPHYCKL